jgi:hypothetical protein
LSKKIGISRDTLKERQGIGNLFVVPLVVYSITFLGKIYKNKLENLLLILTRPVDYLSYCLFLAIVAFQLQESLSRPSKFSGMYNCEICTLIFVNYPS